jgi:hypothetical protein
MCLEWHWRDRNDFFIGANLSIYYNCDYRNGNGLNVWRRNCRRWASIPMHPEWFLTPLLLTSF